MERGACVNLGGGFHHASGTQGTTVVCVYLYMYICMYKCQLMSTVLLDGL